MWDALSASRCSLLTATTCGIPKEFTFEYRDNRSDRMYQTIPKSVIKIDVNFVSKNFAVTKVITSFDESFSSLFAVTGTDNDNFCS